MSPRISVLARAHAPVTAYVKIEGALTPLQRQNIRRTIDRRNERLGGDGPPFVIRQRSGFCVTVDPSDVDVSDEDGGASFPSVADVRRSAIDSAHREADAIAIATGIVFTYSVTIGGE